MLVIDITVDRTEKVADGLFIDFMLYVIDIAFNLVNEPQMNKLLALE